MHSVTVHVVGQLMKDPELRTKNGKTYTRFGVIGTDYGVGSDGTSRERTAMIWLVAFGALGDVVAHCRVGDQVILQAHLRSDSWLKNGERQYTTSFIVDGVRFGKPGRVKREEFARRELELSEASDSTMDIDPDVEEP